MRIRQLALLFPVAVVASGAAFAGCSDPAPPPPPTPPALKWETVAKGLPAALLSVSGTSDKDVWVVGADKSPASGPSVLHYDGAAWTPMVTGQHADLWWVHAVAGGPVFMAGAGGMILRYANGAFERMKTPGLGKDTVFGVWAASATDAYAVGGWSGHNGFLWHFDGTAWSQVRLPDDIPRLANSEVPGLFKVWGTGPEDVWVTGGAGTVLHGGKTKGFSVVKTTTKETLFTVSGASDGLVGIVGGGGNGLIFESKDGATVADVSPPAVPLIQGIALAAGGAGWAVGEKAFVYRRSGKQWAQVDHQQELGVQSLHATWIDPSGGLWAVGGNVLSTTLDAGAILHEGAVVPTYQPAVISDGGLDGDAAPAAVCPAAVIAAGQGKSIARQWNEQIIASIRRDLPRPPVHARSLYHLSAAMWDAWASYDATADGVFVTEKSTAPDVALARNEAVSYAAYRVLSARYQKAVGGAISIACYDAVMKRLGYDPTDSHATGADARAVGNRVGAAVLAANLGDGANEAMNYADATFMSVNPPLVMDQIGAPAGTNPDKWQQLNLSVAATQNGIILPAGVQTYVGAQWGSVTPFALTKVNPADPWKDAGSAPKISDPGMKAWLTEVIARGAEYDPTAVKTIDISPGAIGNNSLGANDGKGLAQNPATGQPYAANVVPVADFGRVLAEFWADGPKSETPPGHWNVIANYASDNPLFARKLGGVGSALDALEWDVKMYLALNGAVHDAACSAWDIKRRQLGGRPSTYIRYMGGKGQSSDPTGASYNAEGLPLVPNLIEVITAESSAPGQRHELLHLYVGQVAVRTWRSEPGDRVNEVGGVGWIRAVEWWPYQRRSFVTPPFPGFISGHSTYSRSAAEVMADLTGSPLFPGGLGEVTLSPGFLSFEKGPSAPVKLQWATYYDAADQAGQSRIWGSIHIEPDDFAGRKVGSLVGKGAVALARKYFDGSAR
jgi:hypothetical protein